MKKQYNNPMTICTEVRLTTVLCNSVRTNVDMNYGGGGNTGSALAPGRTVYI